MIRTNTHIDRLIILAADPLRQRDLRDLCGNKGLGSM